MIKKIINHPTIKSLQKRFGTFKESKRAKILGKVLTYSFYVGVFIFFIYQLREIDWWVVWESLPLNPLFYILILIHYFVLPISEQFIYRLSLKFSFLEGVKVFVKKKILNTDLYPYSGEAYFYWWGRKNLEEDHKHVFNVVKDNNIISSIASTLMALIFFIVYLYLAQESILDFVEISMNTAKWIIIAIIFSLPIVIYLLRFFISMPFKIATIVFGVHTFRFIAAYALEIAQWMVVMPDVPLHVWLVFSGTKMVASRLPFIPNVDLVFVPLSVAIADQVGIDNSQALALFATVFAINKIINIVFYALLTVFGVDRIDEKEIETEA